MGAFLDHRLQSQESVFIIGMMAVGKSTIGRLLAEKLGYGFYDTDDLIRDRCGCDIPWIFDVEGEAGFRNREQQVIEEYTKLPSVVLATGGGAVVRDANRQVLSKRGRVVYLYSDIDTLVARAAQSNSRPLLANHDLRPRLTQLIKDRGPLYSQIADLCVESMAAHPQKTVRAVLKRWRGERVCG